MTVRVGFYGAGLISRTHTALLATSSVDHDIVAVHDPDEARAERFADRHGARAVGEDELLDVVDAVFVTTWTSAHERLVRKVADRGLAVFCEKPVAMDAAVVESMVDAVEAAGVTNQVGLILRMFPQFVLTRQLIGDARAGRLMAVSFRDDQYIPNRGRYRSTWRVDPARAGRGTLLEHSIHDVDILRWICGEVDGVSAAMREMHGHDRIDDVTVARLEFASGAIASLTSVWHDVMERPSMRHIEFFCERLYVRLEDGPDGMDLRWQFDGGPAETLGGDLLREACAGIPGLPTADTVPYLGGFVFNSATAFLAAVRDGEPSPLPLREALPAHRLVDALYESADSDGGVVRMAR